MTFKVLKSQIGDDFVDRVERFRKAKLAHHSTIGEPAPVEHDLIEACVHRVPQGEDDPDDYVSDYEIVDDTPPPPTLDEKKAKLVHALSLAEQKAMADAMPHGKRRLFQFDLMDAQATPADHRTPAEKDMIAKGEALTKHARAVSRHAAKMHAQIDDLTEADIDKWQVEPFPES